ncbi:MAG TPA: molybdopterin cofactor-binding domain-containing protein [Thermoanaerobaculia bacterium]|nr:molybdopterin cofactor-binding domain-containing protein [Thermoanaerobaculia bacterium]
MSGSPGEWSRRGFLKVLAAAGGGLVVGYDLAGCRAPVEPAGPAGPAEQAVRAHRLDVFVEVRTDGLVTITAPVPEIGQGVRTALPMIVAEELAVDWDDVRVEQAPADERFGAMSVGGSDSVRAYWEPLRRAGAAARELLIAAAAAEWGVAAGDCAAAGGWVTHPPTGRRLGYGELAAAAAALDPVADPPLTPVDRFDVVGRRIRRVDLEPLVQGRAVYGIDVEVDGMRFATVERPPSEGAVLEGFDAGAALAVPGVIDVFAIEPLMIDDLRYGRVRGGVAVVADGTWPALEGKRRLQVRWREGDAAEDGSARLAERMRRALDGPPHLVVRDEGDFDREWAQGARRFEAEYELPLLAHGCLEPMGFTADVRADRCDAWGPTQVPLRLKRFLAAALDLPEEAVSVTPTLEGGGFGRRLAWDYGIEAALVSRRAGAPVKVLWTREDDVHGDYFRAPSLHRLQATADAAGRVTGWSHHLVTPPLNVHIGGPEVEHPALYDVAGGADLPYRIPNLRFAHTPVDVALQLGSWRSVSHSFNVFAVNSFIDEIAAGTGVDPLALHRRLLGEPRQDGARLGLPGRRGNPRWDTGRLRRVLDLAAEAAGWGEPLPAGRGRGIACSQFGETYNASVAEVEVAADGAVRVLRVVCAIDCGIVVNPDGVEAQVEGAVTDGVASVLQWEITFEKGRVRQSNFHDFPLLRIDQAPRVEVHLVPSREAPSGTGEPPYPPVPPAIVNAIYAATGKRHRRLPIS